MGCVTDNPRVLLVPGFTQTAASWSAVLRDLRGACDAHALEVPRRDSFAATADALAQAGGRGVWVGYSMGGRLALRLAVDHPEMVNGLVLVSASAGIAMATEREARVQADELLAQSIEQDGVEAFLETWLAQPMFASVPPDAPGLAERRALDPATLTHQLRVLGTGRMEPLWDRLGELSVRVLLVTGSADAKFDAINARMLTAIPAARHTRLQGGHALPLEQPAALAAAIRELVLFAP